MPVSKNWGGQGATLSTGRVSRGVGGARMWPSAAPSQREKAPPFSGLPFQNLSRRGRSLVVQWLRLCFHSRGPGSIPSRGTKIL